MTIRGRKLNEAQQRRYNEALEQFRAEIDQIPEPELPQGVSMFSSSINRPYNQVIKKYGAVLESIIREAAPAGEAADAD